VLGCAILAQILFATLTIVCYNEFENTPVAIGVAKIQILLEVFAKIRGPGCTFRRADR
jgi:hypothetical protein